MLGGCQSLVNIHSAVTGDPLEKAVLEGIKWRLMGKGIAASTSGEHSIQIVHSFPFNASLRRMSNVISVDPLGKGSRKSCFWVVSKGAPEAMAVGASHVRTVHFYILKIFLHVTREFHYSISPCCETCLIIMRVRISTTWEGGAGF